MQRGAGNVQVQAVRYVSTCCYDDRGICSSKAFHHLQVMSIALAAF